MFGNLFKSEATKAKEDMEAHNKMVIAFLEEHDLFDAWEMTRRFIFRYKDVDDYINVEGTYDRNNFYFKSAKAKLVQSAFTSYLLVKVMPQFFEMHLQTLKRKEGILQTQDEYGVWNFEKWFEEVDYFYDKVVKNNIYAWIEENTEQLNTLWLVQSADVNVWGRPEYYQFELSGVFDFCATSYINSVVAEVPEPELPEYNPMLNGHEYEHFVANEFEKCGAQAQVTKGSGDHGLDILVTYRDIRIAVQCKHYQAKVGNKAIQEVFSAKKFYDCTIAIVISNNEFTPHARQAAQKLDVYLHHHEEISLLIDIIDDWLDKPDVDQ